MPSTEMIEWTASAGRIHANGEVFNIKGANWFGTEGQHAMLYGLEKHGLDYYLEFLAANKFNSLRLLFNHEYVLSDPSTSRGGPRRARWASLATRSLSCTSVMPTAAAEAAWAACLGRSPCSSSLAHSHCASSSLLSGRS